MNMKFYKSCYDLAALSTCVQQNANNKIWHYMSDARINFDDNFYAIAKYKVVCSDFLSASDYENHEFSISFVRDGQVVETLHFRKKIDRTNIGSLANPELSLEDKLKAIREYRPSVSNSLEFALKKTKLSSKEVKMVIDRDKKMFEELTVTQKKKR